MSIKLRKIYSELEKGEYCDSIITYRKIPWLRKSIPYDPTITYSDQNPTYIAQYKKGIKIDLWIIKLEFNWLTKEN